MEKTENTLTKVHNQEIFEDIYVLDSDKDIILNETVSIPQQSWGD